MDSLVVPANVEKYEEIYKRGYDKRYPTLDLVRLEAWYLRDRSGRVLDFACGTGVNLIHLAECGYSVVGVDAAEESVRLVRKKLADRPDLASRASARALDRGQAALPFADGDFDVVVCMSVLSLLESKERIAHLIDEFHRVLRPGGKLIADINGPDSDFATKGRFVADDVFEYVLREGQASPLRIYCPQAPEVFARMFAKFTVDDVGHASFRYCGHDSHEFIVLAHKAD